MEQARRGCAALAVDVTVPDPGCQAVRAPAQPGADRAAVLRALHRTGDPLVLPNAWDAASARAVEAAGFPVVATSSAAIAAVLGSTDGEVMSVQEALDHIADHAGTGLVINARIDTYLRSTGTPAQLLDLALHRTGLYLAAGADCVYPIAAAEPQAIRALAQRAGGRVNVMYASNTPTLAELAGLGVSRISFGAGLHRTTQAHLAVMLDRIAVGGSPYADEPPT